VLIEERESYRYSENKNKALDKTDTRKKKKQKKTKTVILPPGACRHCQQNLVREVS